MSLETNKFFIDLKQVPQAGWLVGFIEKWEYIVDNTPWNNDDMQFYHNEKDNMGRLVYAAWENYCKKSNKTRKIAIGTYFELTDFAIQKVADRKGIVVYPEKDDNEYTIFWTVPEDKQMKRPSPKSKDWDKYFKYVEAHSLGEFKRDDPDLVAVIEELGNKATSGKYSNAHIVEIPAYVDWEICSDDEFGIEHVEEKHRTWR